MGEGGLPAIAPILRPDILLASEDRLAEAGGEGVIRTIQKIIISKKFKRVGKGYNNLCKRGRGGYFLNMENVVIISQCFIVARFIGRF